MIEDYDPHEALIQEREDYDRNGPYVEPLEDSVPEVDDSNTADLPLMDQPIRQSNVYSVRLDETLVAKAKEWGRAALDSDSLSDVIRAALGRIV